MVSEGEAVCSKESVSIGEVMTSLEVVSVAIVEEMMGVYVISTAVDMSGWLEGLEEVVGEPTPLIGGGMGTRNAETTTEFSSAANGRARRMYLTIVLEVLQTSKDWRA